MSRLQAVLVVLALVSFTGCASRSPTTSIPPKTGTLSGSVTDRVGDSMPSARAPRPPDLVAATIEVSDGNLVVTVRFAPQTLSEQTGITVWLDTDENAATGTIAFYGDNRAIGADYVIRGLQPHNPASASITHEVGPKQSVFGGIVAVNFPAADERRIVVPLARLGNDDGRLRFKLECYQVVESSQAGQTSTQTILSHLDLMPNLGAAAGVVH